jgi:hypothetical protein
VDCYLKLKPSDDSKFDTQKYENFMNKLIAEKEDSQLMVNFRKYLTIVGNLDYKLTDKMQKVTKNI